MSLQWRTLCAGLALLVVGCGVSLTLVSFQITRDPDEDPFPGATDVLVAVSRWTIGLAESGWGPTVLRLPPGTWTDRITGAVHAGAVNVSALFAELPVMLLEKDDG